MEYEIIDIIKVHLSCLEGITVDVTTQDTDRVGSKIRISFDGNNTSIICRWHKQGKRFDCWYQNENNGVQVTDIMYRLHGVHTATAFCGLVRLGAGLSKIQN